jgi:hypothetical protein
VSTYDAGSDRLNPGLGSRGPRALTFAPLLGSRFIPFNDLVKRLLALSEEVVGSPVEIEFAVNLDRRDLLPARFGFLQLRPMMVGGEKIDVSEDELVSENVLVASEAVLGNGSRNDIEDVVYIPPQSWDPNQTQLIAKEIEAVNQSLVQAGQPYLLIGFGRWGTSDPRLGLPVAWGQISGARVIVEATLPDVQPDLSQGSHFFHNLLSFRVLYLSVEHHGALSIDWQWLAQQPMVRSTGRVVHTRLRAPLDVRVDGGSGRGVIVRDE